MGIGRVLGVGGGGVVMCDCVNVYSGSEVVRVVMSGWSI